MPITVTMPRLSDTMEQGTVVKWHVKEGDTVNQGDMIADIETDKATMELEAFDSGTVAKLAAAEGERVPVGETIMVIAEEGESVEAVAASVSTVPARRAAGSSIPEQTTTSTAVATSASPTPPTPPADMPIAPVLPDTPRSNSTRVIASPLARKVAAERGIDLTTIRGTGPGGRITRKDVEAASGTAALRAAPETRTDLGSENRGTRDLGSENRGTHSESRGTRDLVDKSVPLSGMRETIARRLVQSKTTIPHYQVTVSARLDALLELRGQLNAQLEPQGIKLSVNDFLVRACALAMHQHPFINSSWNPKGPSIDLHGDVNIGVAVALPPERGGGLVVATLRNADRTGLRQISAETKRLAKKAREKGLSVEDMADSTFTISNLGMFGVDHFTAIINPPNAAILAVGRAVEKPFIEKDDEGEPVLVIGHEMSMTMSSDHRVIDGAMAAAYLNSVKELLENPATLLV